MKIFNIFLLTTLILTISNAQNTYNFNDFNVSYELNINSKEIQFTLSSNHTGWISIGFGSIYK